MDLTDDDFGDAGGGVTVQQSAVDEVAFLSRSVHRVVALQALAERPRRRSALQELTGVSTSTIGRTLRAFERRRWIRRTGHEYETTQLGAFVASGMRRLLDRLETERQLRDVWQSLPGADSGLTVEMLADAVVTVADVSGPYAPVNRFVTLLSETDRFRFVGADLALLEPCRDEFRRRVLEGMEAEIIDPPGVATYVRSTYPDHCAEPLASDNFGIRIHDEAPSYGVALFDDRVGVVGYDAGSGTVQVLVDTDATAVREWAASTYEAYRRESRPMPIGVTSA